MWQEFVQCSSFCSTFVVCEVASGALESVACAVVNVVVQYLVLV